MPAAMAVLGVAQTNIGNIVPGPHAREGIYLLVESCLVEGGGVSFSYPARSLARRNGMMCASCCGLVHDQLDTLQVVCLGITGG